MNERLTLSQLIARLQSELARHGDVPVRVCDGDSLMSFSVHTETGHGDIFPDGADDTPVTYLDVT